MDDNTIRLTLHTLLEAAFPSCAIFYRPPGNIELSRPCIVYEPKASEPSFANNQAYTIGTRFQVTLLSDLPGIDKRPMYSIPKVVILGNQSYVSSNIVHDVFNVSLNSIT